MNVMQILTTQGIHSYRLATVHFTATPKRNYLMKKKATHILVSFTDTQRYQLVNGFYTILYNIGKDKR